MIILTPVSFIGSTPFIFLPPDTVPEIARYISLPVKTFPLIAQNPDNVLVMPVQGASVKSVVDTWGAPRSGGRKHEGQDIFASRGTPVYSASNGVVIHIGENALGGKTIFVMGAGGRRYYYAHLDSYASGLRVGDSVTTNSVLGYVGTTGNAEDTPPHLHFGVYTSSGAINPLPMLHDRT